MFGKEYIRISQVLQYVNINQIQMLLSLLRRDTPVNQSGVLATVS